MKLDGVELPIGLRWIDEFDWSPVIQSVEYGLTGSIIIQEAVKQNWQPVTLKGGMSFSPITRADLISLAAQIDAATATMTLTLNDNTELEVYPVRETASPIKAVAYPVVLDSGVANPDDDVMYYIEEITLATSTL